MEDITPISWLWSQIEEIAGPKKTEEIKKEYNQRVNERAKLIRSSYKKGNIYTYGQNSKHTQTSIEKTVSLILEAQKVQYVEQYMINRTGAKAYTVDFYIPTLNLVIECDGDYWHGERKPGAIEKDTRKNAYLTEKGYTVLRLPEGKIKAGELEELYAALNH